VGSPRRGAGASESRDSSTPNADRHAGLDKPRAKRQKWSPSQEPALSTNARNASSSPRGTPSTAQATTATAHQGTAEEPATDPNNGFEPMPRARKSRWQDGTLGMTNSQAVVRAPTTQSRGATNNARVGPSGQQSRRASGSRGGGGVNNATGKVHKVNELVKQPETRRIGQEQLVVEVKGIYAG
ncbi:hypothetical protein M9X92_011862, partial [Pyricularia oryzae]